MDKLLRLIVRVLQGRDIILVSQTKAQWNRQFADGKWDRLEEGQANTMELARHILELAHLKGHLRVLDVGCGNGGLARCLTDDSRITYTGIDISDVALAAARKNGPRGHYVLADAGHPPPSLGVFDILVFNEVLFYIRPDEALAAYESHASVNALVLVSVIRSWRTPLLFRRIGRRITSRKRWSVADGEHVWDLMRGYYL